MHRICIYTQDIIILTGRSESYAREVLRDIRLLLKKERHQLITIAEFCEHMGLPYEDVFNRINKIGVR
ncbi:hypothetical protein [Aestuariivivens marinum]|uniref:hypothetical protein n=1 Tax=Aestuariivivens marinum TaxID=2913555 RepID=UPI001F586F8A|nr:hypothetical protein [Aestuariivivens marinum]